MATSLAEGIGLQTEQRDDWWMRQLATDRNNRLAQEKKDKDALIKMGDIDIDYSKLLPAYGKAVGQEVAGYLNKVAAANQNGSGNSLAELAMEKQRLMQRVGELQLGNINAYGYVYGKGFKKRPEVVEKLTSFDSTIDQFGDIDDGEFIKADNNGYFGFVPVPDEEIPVKFDKDQGTYKNQATGKRRTVGNVEFYETQDRWMDSYINQVAAGVATNPTFIMQVKHDNREAFQPIAGEDEATYRKRVTEFIKQKAAEKVAPQIPHNSFQEFHRVIPQGRAGDRPEKDKRFVPQVQEDVPITRPDGKETKAYMQFNTPGVPEVALQLNNEFLDAGQERIKESGVINFTSRSVRAVPIEDKNGNMTIKLYSIGKGIQQVDVPPKKGETATGTKIQREIEIMVPYEQVADVIEQKVNTDVPMELYNRKFSKVSGKVRRGDTPPGEQQSSFRYKVKGKNGKTIFSADGQSWVDESGNPVK